MLTCYAKRLLLPHCLIIILQIYSKFKRYRANFDTKLSYTKKSEYLRIRLISLQNYTLKMSSIFHILPFLPAIWSCPRPISNSQLHALLHFHLCPIYLVVFKGSYCFRMGYLILRGASRLDAFSVYPVPAWLLCHDLG